MERRFPGGSAQIMAVFSPLKQLEVSRDLERAFFGKAPTAGMLRVAYGVNTAEAWLEVQLNNLSEFAGCKEKLDEPKRLELAAMILESYPHYKLTEFMIFFLRFKRGEYGKFYGAVDPMVILQALDAFDTDRTRKLEERRQAIEKARREESFRERDRLERRYMARVPGAFTGEAAINFMQYRLMGYDEMDDIALAAEIKAISDGTKTIPADIRQILETIQSSFDIDNGNK